MPFFNFRRASLTPASAAGAAQPESMEEVRKRAKHRLIGAAVLVLLGVVGFPLLFDTQPRPVAVDIPIEIPGKNSVKPLTLPALATKSDAAKEPAAPVPEAAPDKVATSSSLGAKEQIVADKKPAAAAAPVVPAPKKDTEPAALPEAKVASKPEPKPQAKVEAKPETKTETRPAPKADDGARAKALLDGQATAPPSAASAAAAEGRMVVQVGAFADDDKAREVRQKLERAGLKTYTQVAATKDGKRTRVRVGPFATRAEAEKAAGKIKTLDLPASILTL